ARLLAMCDNGSYEVWNLADGQRELSQRKQEFFSDYVHSVGVSDDFERLIWLRGVAEDISVVEVASGERVFHLAAGAKDHIDSAALSPDGRFVAAAVDKALRIWDTKSGEALPNFNGNDDQTTGVVFMSPEQLVSCGPNGAVRLWDVKTGE